LEQRLLFVGDDWAEDRHDVEIQSESGRVLARAKLPEGVAGIARLHTMIGEHLGDDDEADVVVGIETDRGPWVQALIAAGYEVFAINPLRVARFRERYDVSGATASSASSTAVSGPTRTTASTRRGRHSNKINKLLLDKKPHGMSEQRKRGSYAAKYGPQRIYR
jgi:hypothetical protein